MGLAPVLGVVALINSLHFTCWQQAGGCCRGVTFQGQTAFYLECDWSLRAAAFPHPGGTAYPKTLSTELQERPQRHRYDTGGVCKRALVLLILQYLFEF